MARCDMCGNDYDKAFTVTQQGVAHTFDSFECAIHARVFFTAAHNVPRWRASKGCVTARSSRGGMTSRR